MSIIHAREDVTGKEAHKETFATAAAAALHGGVVHVADMPNNPAAPIDDASYRVKVELLQQARLEVVFTLYAGIGPGTKPLTRNVPYKAYMGPSVGELFFSSLEQLDETLSAYRGKPVSFHCEDPVLLEKHNARRVARAAPAARMRIERDPLRAGNDRKAPANGQAMPLLGGRGVGADSRREAARRAVTAEVTPHHVFFDTAMITDDSRPWMQNEPPLRSPADRAAMLEALRDGTADYWPPITRRTRLSKS